MPESQRNTGGQPPDDPREALRKRMSEQEPIKVYLSREGDNVLGQHQYASDQYPTKFTQPGQKGYAAILANADLSGMFEPPEVPNGALVAVYLLGYAPRAYRELNPQVGEWVGIRRGPLVQGVDSKYNRWDIYSAREDAGKIDLSELPGNDDDDWSTGPGAGQFNDPPNF